MKKKKINKVYPRKKHCENVLNIGVINPRFLDSKGNRIGVKKRQLDMFRD